MELLIRQMYLPRLPCEGLDKVRHHITSIAYKASPVVDSASIASNIITFLLNLEVSAAKRTESGSIRLKPLAFNLLAVTALKLEWKLYSPCY